jgi:hypothetical protein
MAITIYRLPFMERFLHALDEAIDNLEEVNYEERVLHSKRKRRIRS